MSLAEAAPKTTRHPAEHIPAIAHMLANPGFSNGERAALKRMGLDGTAPLALHRCIVRHVDEAWQDPRWTPRWRTVICALALQRDGGHSPERSLGSALVAARYAESRLERLLAAQGDTLFALALRAARQLAAARLSCDWRQFADLIFATTPDGRERINTRIARDFYRNLPSKD